MEHCPTNPVRAGRYVTQPTGYKAFIPSPLPPDPPIRITGELQTLLSETALALGRLDGSIQTLPNADLFVLMYVRKEAVLQVRSRGRKARCKTCWRPKQRFSRRIDRGTWTKW